MTASTTAGFRCPTLSVPRPPVKSSNTLPSTSVTVAPSAVSTKIGARLKTPWGTAAFRRASKAWLLGPGIGVLRRIVFTGDFIPANRFLAQVDMHLRAQEEFFDTGKGQFPSLAALFAAAPRRL